MTHDPRPHIHRRREAIDRLRGLSTVAAVAGIAGTAGFGAIAAISWSGDPTATPLPATTGTTNAGSGSAAQPRTTRVQPATPNGGFAQPPTVTTPRVGRGTGGHASTGGSH
jgi:hypothetical protein